MAVSGWERVLIHGWHGDELTMIDDVLGLA